MKYNKSKRVLNGNRIFKDEELQRVEMETGAFKRDHIENLNRKVRKFEDKVARDEKLAK